MRSIRVVAEPIDLAQEHEALRGARTDIGAIVTFMGYCRDEGGSLAALELEHFPGMAEAEIDRLAREAEARWPLRGLRIVHRYGLIRPGEPIVLVATASAHRAAAFEAAAFLMDYLKTDAPFWKREHRLDLVTDPRETETWVGAKAADELVKARWQPG